FEGFTVNNAVTSSKKVNKAVACWLGKEGDPTCIPSGPVPGEVSAAAPAAALVVPKLAEQLAQIPQNAEVGVPLAARAMVSAAGVRQVDIYQRNDAGRTMPPPDANATVPFSFSG